MVKGVTEALESPAIRKNIKLASEEARGADGLGRLVAEAERLICYSVNHPHVENNGGDEGGNDTNNDKIPSEQIHI